MKKITLFLFSVFIILIQSASIFALHYSEEYGNNDASNFIIGKVDKIVDMPNRKSLTDGSLLNTQGDYDIYTSHNFRYTDMKEIKKDILKKRTTFQCEEPRKTKKDDVILFEIDEKTENDNMIIAEHIQVPDTGGCDEKIFYITCYNDVFYVYSDDPFKKINIYEDMVIRYEKSVFESYYIRKRLQYYEISSYLKNTIKTCDAFEKNFGVKAPDKLPHYFEPEYPVDLVLQMSRLYIRHKDRIEKLRKSLTYEDIEKVRARLQKGAYTPDQIYQKHLILDAIAVFLYR